MMVRGRTLARTAIFYLLRLQNALKVTIPHDDFLSGLEVCFYTRNEIESMIRDCGFEIVESLEDEYGPRRWGKLVLLRNLGTKSYILRPKDAPAAD